MGCTAGILHTGFEHSNFELAAVMTLFVMELLTGVGHFFFFTDDCL
jgi:hypothetical protein